MKPEDVVCTIAAVIIAMVLLYGFSQLSPEAQESIMNLMEAMD